MRRSLAILFLLLFSIIMLASSAGTYTGKWIGTNAEGDYKIILSQAEKGEWNAEVSFT